MNMIIFCIHMIEALSWSVKEASVISARSSLALSPRGYSTQSCEHPQIFGGGYSRIFTVITAPAQSHATVQSCIQTCSFFSSFFPFLFPSHPHFNTFFCMHLHKRVCLSDRPSVTCFSIS